MEGSSSYEGGRSGPSTSSSPLRGDSLGPPRSQTAGSATLLLSPITEAQDRINSEPASSGQSRLRSWSSGSRGRSSPRASRKFSRDARKKSGLSPPGDLPEEVAPLVSRRPVHFFKEKHILVEMNELRGASACSLLPDPPSPRIHNPRICTRGARTTHLSPIPDLGARAPPPPTTDHFGSLPCYQ